MAERNMHPNSLANLSPPFTSENNPGKGRQAAGATVREWINALSAQRLPTKELRQIARDDSADWNKQVAAARMVAAAEKGDMADFEPLLKGEVGLVGLRENGVNTDVIKKYKVKTRILKEEGLPVGEEIDREIELHDRGGENFDRCVETTDGKARQPVDLTTNTPTSIVMEVVGMPEGLQIDPPKG